MQRIQFESCLLIGKHMKIHTSNGWWQAREVLTTYECLASLWSVYCVPPFLWGKRRADPHNCFQVFLLLSLSLLGQVSICASENRKWFDADRWFSYLLSKNSAKAILITFCLLKPTDSDWLVILAIIITERIRRNDVQNFWPTTGECVLISKRTGPWQESLD